MAKQIEFDSLFSKKSFDDGVADLVKVIGKITEEIELAELAGRMLSETLGKKLKGEIASISSVSKTLSKDLSDMTKKMEEYKMKTVQIDKVTKAYKDETERLAKELEKLKTAQEKANKETEKAGSSTKKASNSYAGLSQSLLGVASGAALVYSGVRMLTNQVRLAVESAIEFEHAMKQVQAVSRSSNEELAILTANANKLGATTEKTAGQIANLQVELAKLGFNTTEILASTSAITDLSTATGEDLVSSGIVAAATLRAFGLEATEMNRVVDVMAGSFVRSGLDLEKFRESMKLIAPIAKATNVDLEIVTASISKLADTGISGSLAGTAMRNLLSSMADPSEDLVMFLGQLNSTLSDGVKDTADFTLALKELRKANIDLETAVGMVDVRARSAFFTLVDQADGIEALAYEYRQLDGEAREIANLMRTDLKTNIELSNSAFDAMRRNIAEQFNPQMVEAAQLLTIISEATRILTNDVKGLFDVISTSDGVLGAYLDFLKTYSAPALLINSITDYAAGGGMEEGLKNSKIAFDQTKKALDGLNSEMVAYSTLSDVIENGLGAKTAGGVLGSLQGLSKEYDTFFEGVRKGELSEEGAIQAIFTGLEKSLQNKKTLIEIQNQIIKDSNALIQIVEEKGSEGATPKDIADVVVAREKIKLAQSLLSEYGAQADILDRMFKANVKDKKTYDDKEDIAEKAAKKFSDLTTLELKLLEEKTKGELDAFEGELKIAEAKEDSAISIFLIEQDIINKKKDLASIAYQEELRLIELAEDGTEQSLLRRQLAYEKYYNKITSLAQEAELKQIKDVNSTDEQAKKSQQSAFDASMKLAQKITSERAKINSKANKDQTKSEEEEREERVKIAEFTAQKLSELTRMVFDNEAAKRANELTAIDNWEQERLRLAGDNEEAKAAIEKEAEKRRNKVRTEQAKSDRMEALFQIAIATAVNIVKAGGNPLKIAIAAASGLLQASLVAARPLPKFEKGTNFSPEGHAIVGERGRELIKDGRSGNWRMSSDGASQTYLSRGSKVIPAHITAKILEGNHDHNGIAEQYLNKLSKKEEKQLFDYNKLGEKFENAVTKIPVNQTNFDENGVTRFTIKRNSKVQRLNKRY